MRALSLPLILLLGFSPFSSASTPEPLKAPYAPLMSPMGIENPLPTDADIAQMVQTFQFVNSHNGRWDVDRGDYGVFWAGPSAGRDAQGKTRGEKAKELNPKFALSNYRMSQYTQQACSNEAAEVEKRFPLGISVSETSAKLANHISSAKDTTILVIPPERTEAQKDLPAIYPFKVSTTDEEYSTNPKKCVTWFRIGDEILRIDKAQPKDDLIELTVQRGYWGTKAVSHEKFEPLFTPIYMGSIATSGPDKALIGWPGTDATQFWVAPRKPGASDELPATRPAGIRPGIIYHLQMQNPEFHQWLGEKCQRYFDEGFEVVWLDLNSSLWYDTADCYGMPAVPWNFEKNAPMDADSFLEFQRQKVDALFRQFPDRQFFVNNLHAGRYFDGPVERKLLTGEGGHHPVSGAVMENYAGANDEEGWAKIASQTLDMVQSKFWAIAWSKGHWENELPYRQFAYATYLMAYEPGCRVLFGGEWHRNLYGKVEPVFYWDLGAPQQTFKDIAEAKHPTAKGVYQRQFEKALVLVNPTDQASERIELDREYYDPDQKGLVKEVKMTAMSGKILLLN